MHSRADRLSFEAPLAEPTTLVEQARDLVKQRVTLGEVIPVLTEPALLAASDALLLSVPGFRELHAELWDPALPELEALATLPEGSFGRCYAAYMAHYRLAPDFFPIQAELDPEATPTRYAVHRLNKCHDFFHVLGAYETSDADEVAVQSFVFGLAPSALALFLAAASVHPDILRDKYKHLRDIYEGRIQAHDFVRGVAATALLGARLESLMEEPLDGLRQRLGLGARTDFRPGHPGENTCSGRSVPAFFTHAAAQVP
ncbi:Coq4 family protein [Myxococcus faecalis]|uniref:Coq4 family protein n=1 Tax=Myxococcus faecalis TaxID=3115646 RepID=UPI003CED5A73